MGATGTVAIGEPRLARNARIRRGMEGPQLVVEWDAPEEIGVEQRIRVVRKQYEFAASPFDSQGMVVFEGPAAAGFVADLDVGPCRCYYYTVFTHAFFPKEEWLFSVDTQIAEIAVPTGYFGRDGGMFRLLPDTYVLEDKLLGEEVVVREDAIYALQPTFDADGREWFNLGENTDPEKEPKRKGPLQRFLKTIALELDLVKGLIDCMPTLWDVDETCCANLPALGEVIGLQVNRELPCSAQRQEIKEHVAILKVKGTATAIRARARSVSGFETFVQECGDSLLITNREDRTTLLVDPNPGFASLFLRPGDPTDFTPGGVFTPNAICVYFILECDDCLSEQVVRKLNRVLPPEFPACHPGHLIFLDCDFVEDPFDRSRLEEFADEIHEDATAEEVAFKTCWLITNSLPEPPDSPDAGPGKPFAANLTNSIGALTANPSPICAELFDDEIICSPLVLRARVDCSRVG